MNRTADEFEAQAKKHNIKEWDNHDCVMCGYMCKHLFIEGKVYYDPGCHCTGRGHGENLELRSWQEIAEQYNMQNDAWQKTYDWNSNDDRIYVYLNKITMEQRPLTEQQYRDTNYTLNER